MSRQEDVESSKTTKIVTIYILFYIFNRLILKLLSS